MHIYHHEDENCNILVHFFSSIVVICERKWAKMLSMRGCLTCQVCKKTIICIFYNYTESDTQPISSDSGHKLIFHTLKKYYYILQSLCSSSYRINKTKVFFGHYTVSVLLYSIRVSVGQIFRFKLCIKKVRHSIPVYPHPKPQPQLTHSSNQ